MSVASELKIVRVFDAPRELVYENWTTAEHVAGWFAPDGFTVTSCAIDARAGASWRVEYRSVAGEVYVEHGEFVELSRPGRLVLTLTQHGPGGAGPQTTVTVTLDAVEGKTRMTFLQTGFDSARRRDDNAEGWGECFSKLEAQLKAQTTARSNRPLS